jgi:hypothetical protein
MVYAVLPRNLAFDGLLAAKIDLDLLGLGFGLLGKVNFQQDASDLTTPGFGIVC